MEWLLFSKMGGKPLVMYIWPCSFWSELKRILKISQSTLDLYYQCSIKKRKETKTEQMTWDPEGTLHSHNRQESPSSSCDYSMENGSRLVTLYTYICRVSTGNQCATKTRFRELKPKPKVQFLYQFCSQNFFDDFFSLYSIFFPWIPISWQHIKFLFEKFEMEH